MLITLRDISVQFTREPVLDHVNLTMEAGERLCLVGRNGAGKSTLMRIINGRLEPDGGEVEHADTLRIAQLEQDVPAELSGSVYDIVTRGLGEAGRKLMDYNQALENNVGNDVLLELQHRLESAGAWHAKINVESVISRMQLDSWAEFSTLSGGLKRRVLLAKALAGDPDLLLLDEPTNHLDIEGVTWLENMLLGASSALVFISHDRAFLDRIATRIVEVDRGQLHNWPGSYADYRRRKQAALEAEQTANREFDKRLATEEDWIRQGVKARTTRNMGRVRELEKMREEAAGRRKYHRRAEIRAQVAEKSSKRVLEARHLSADLGGKTILHDFNIKIRRGETLGVMGPNGCGKTTLLRILLGEQPPDSGQLIHGENLQIAYFDQNRRQLNLDRDAAWNVADGADRIDFEGKNLHVLGYLRAFLFTPDRARTPVKVLSGGERNRLLLARLFARPSNVLVLDEPTNDLDIETLELLETLVDEYPGTIILVSHDRAFVNNVVNGLLVHDGANGFRYYVGNYDDWLRQRKLTATDAGRKPTKAGSRSTQAKTTRATKLSYKDQRELDRLPQEIEALEARIGELYEQMNDPAFFQQSPGTIKSEQDHLAEYETTLELTYARWEELENIQSDLQRARA